jgi:hypothetical protein
MLNLILTWLVTSISFLIISKLPLGIEIDGFGKAAIAAAVFGLLNALLLPILTVLSKSVEKNKTELRKVNKAITLFPSAFCLLPPALP